MSIRGGGEGGGAVNDVQGERLNPTRFRGFGGARMETPTMSDMRAKQGAIVARFMTFFQRKFSLVIEMYVGAFYRQKPNWDSIAEFVHTDLCNTPDLRKEVKDVQFHPVKMLLFIKFSGESCRDAVVQRVQSAEGVTWGEYGLRVKGYSLDAEVKFIRLLGVSPETGEEEIKKTFLEVGIGEVTEIKKGWLDARRLPGVTNGTWALRVKILDQDKVIPSYIHRRDEGELWSLNFEGRIFCCWKCGGSNHIGDKCRDQSRTFEEIFNSSVTDFEKPTWAAVVRSGQRDGDVQKLKIEDIEAKLKEENKKRDRDKKELEDQKKREHEEEERKRLLDEAGRQEAIKRVEDTARQVIKELEDEKKREEEEEERKRLLDEAGKQEVIERVEGSDRQVPIVIEDRHSNDDSDDMEDNTLFLKFAEDGQEKSDACSNSQEFDTERVAKEKALLTAIKHKSWMDARSARKLLEDLSINQELDRIFGPGASLLAIEFQGPEDMQSKENCEDDIENVTEDEMNKNDVEDVINESGQESNTSTSSEETGGEAVDEVNMSVDSGGDDMKTSTPTREPRGKKEV